MLGPKLYAYDLAVENADGVTIYYDIINYDELEVVQPYYTNYSGNVDIPEEVNRWGLIYKVSSIGHHAFDRCSGLTSVTIPNSVTNIGIDAFCDCTGLTSVTIPDSVTNIGSWAFKGCTGLTSVNIPNSVTMIGDGAFFKCSSLVSVTIPSSVKYIFSEAFSKCSSLTTLTIPNSVTYIYTHAFSGCSGLTSVIIPKSVIFIGSCAFADCKSLKSVYISDIFDWCNIYYEDELSNPLYYASHLYLNNEELRDLVIPNGVTSIRYYAFANCSSLTSVVIPNSVTSIHDGAFKNCSSLASINIPNSVTSISRNVFENCSSLTSVIIGEKITEIGSNAFKGTRALKSIYILCEMPPSIEWNTFDNSNYTWTCLYVPTGSKDVYMNLPTIAYWRYFKSIVEFNPATINKISNEKIRKNLRYSLNGQLINKPQKGVNIIKMSDGSTKKVIVK